MNSRRGLALCLSCLTIWMRGGAATAASIQAPENVTVVSPAGATAPEQLAATELAGYLGRIYPKTRVDLYQRAGGPRRVVDLRYPVVLNAPGVVRVTLTPVKGKALVCAALLEAAR